jgi:hypothetical protein
MSDDHGASRQTASTLREAAEPEAAQPGATEDASALEFGPAEDTVPYLPPLASYPLRAIWGETRRGVPTIYPDEILDEDE